MNCRRGTLDRSHTTGWGMHGASVGPENPVLGVNRQHPSPPVTEAWWHADVEKAGDSFQPMTAGDPLTSLLQGSLCWDPSGHP